MGTQKNQHTATWITHDQAARLLGVSANTISNLRKRGSLPMRGPHRASISLDQALDLLEERGRKGRDDAEGGLTPPWITHAQAAQILDVSHAAVEALRGRGELGRRASATERGEPSLSLPQVLHVLAERRKADLEEARLRREREVERRHRPEDGGLWLKLSEAAAILGVSAQAMNNRVKRRGIPERVVNGHRWLELGDVLAERSRSEWHNTGTRVPSASGGDGG